MYCYCYVCILCADDRRRTVHVLERKVGEIESLVNYILQFHDNVVRSLCISDS